MTKILMTRKGVFNPTAGLYESLAKCYEVNEKEKNKLYNERILSSDQGSFKPVVFATVDLRRRYYRVH